MHKWTSSEGCNNGNIPPSQESGSFYIFPFLGLISLANVSFFMNLRDSSKKKGFPESNLYKYLGCRVF